MSNRELEELLTRLYDASVRDMAQSGPAIFEEVAHASSAVHEIQIDDLDDALRLVMVARSFLNTAHETKEFNIANDTMSDDLQGLCDALLNDGIAILDKAIIDIERLQPQLSLEPLDYCSVAAEHMVQ